MTKYRGASSWAMSIKCKSATEKMILVAMARVGDQSRECYMAYHKIADVACCSEWTVIRTIPKLIKRGLIERVSSGHSKRATITYRLCVDGPPVRPIVRAAATSCRARY